MTNTALVARKLAVLTTPGLSCTTSDVRFGFDVDIHFGPREAFDPWFGFGTGLEIQTFTASGPAATVTIRDIGLEFLNFQIGANWGPGPATRARGTCPHLSCSKAAFS